MKQKKIIQALKKHKSFLISTHVSPDPDGLCSEMALALYLKALGKKVIVVNDEVVPERYRFLPDMKQIKSFNPKQKFQYDAAVIVDCGDLSRIGRVQEKLVPGKPVINIDHHITNDFFGDLNLVVPDASSTAEVLYELITKAKGRLTRNLALHLYTGIMTDTGSFRYESTTARTHAITSHLMTFKISSYNLYRKLYEAIPLSDLQAFTEVISSFETLYGGKAVCVQLKRSTMSRFSEEFDLKDSIFKFLRSIKGVDVVMLFIEVHKNQTRINFRSSGKVNVAQIASLLNGGGHRRASGCMINRSMKDAKRMVIAQIEKVI